VTRALVNIVALLLLAVLGWRVREVARTARTIPETWEEQQKARRAVLWQQLVFLLVLLVLAFWYWQGSTVPLGKGTKINLYCFAPNPVGGVPLEVPWFGALGAILLSLQGVFDHREDWDVTHHAWHLARPIVGALVGVVGFYLFVVAITATGSNVRVPGVTTTTTIATPTPSSAKAGPAAAATTADTTFPTSRRCTTLRGPIKPPHPLAPEPKDYIYLALAFILGYREQSFRALVAKVADVVLNPGESRGDEAPTPRPRRGRR
jgi:hypothetical protein